MVQKHELSMILSYLLLGEHPFAVLCQSPILGQRLYDFVLKL